VTVTDNNSCTASGTVNVTVTGSTPLAADAGSARAICTGASTNLGGSPTGTGGAGGYTYSWTSSPAGFTSTAANPSASPTVTTTYTVTVTSSTCTVSSSVVVTVNPRPTVAPTASPSFYMQWSVFDDISRCCRWHGSIELYMEYRLRSFS
jgi:hypothetical protein